MIPITREPYMLAADRKSDNRRRVGAALDTRKEAAAEIKHRLT
jgi:hypothetical protein